MITFSQLGNPFWGRLGNQLFQIAAVIGIAIKNNQDFILPQWDYQSYFKNRLPEGILNQAFEYKQKEFAYKEIFLPEGNWDLQGFFQSEKFFQDVEEEIRTYFQMSEEIQEYINEKYQSLLQLNPCSIHIRRGDYLKQRFSFPPQPLKYYYKAIDLFKKGHPFLVFSDDIEWCRQQFADQNFYFIEGEKDIVDLFIMSLCQDHIIANSSFSWWGAWLNPKKDKRVICPEHWFGKEVAWDTDQKTRDIYAQGFQKLLLEKSWLSKTYYRISNAFIFLLRRGYHFLFSTMKKVKRLIFPN